MMQLLHSEPGGQRHSSIAEKRLLWRVCQQYWRAPMTRLAGFPNPNAFNTAVNKSAHYHC